MVVKVNPLQNILCSFAALGLKAQGIAALRVRLPLAVTFIRKARA